MGIIINEIKDKYDILLHKVNEDDIGAMPMSFLISVSNSLNEIGKIELEINKYYINQIGKRKTKYLLYDEIKNERMISLDGYMYVIKDIKEDTKNDVKSVTAYSKEKKLEKVNISVEDLGFYLQDSDEDNGIYSLDDYMYEETGWRFGHIDDSVKYNEFSEDLLIDEISYDENVGSLSINASYDSNKGDLQLNVQNKTPKMRWQESVDTSWLDYLKKNITTQFTCYVHFDTKNQLVNLYDMASFGDNLGIALSYDNYMKSLEKTSSSSDIVTKLILIGNEEECIVSEENVTGENYIENYSYFIENHEISDELINSLNTYNDVIKIRHVEWKALRDEKLIKLNQLLDKKSREKILIEEIKALENMILYYKEKVNAGDTTGVYLEKLEETIANATIKKNEEKVVYEEICNLENEINDLEVRIDKIVTLCKKKTATDLNDVLIFNQTLLDELKKITFSETFTDDSYYDAAEIISAGEKKLNILCRPTSTWDINSEDFTKRLINNGFRQQWNGVLGLGDIICLYKNSTTETLIYLVGYDKNYKDNTLNLILSDKKESEDVIRYINDYLKLAKSTNKLMNRNKRLLIAQKKNRINISRDEVM